MRAPSGRTRWTPSSRSGPGSGGPCRGSAGRRDRGRRRRAAACGGGPGGRARRAPSPARSARRETAAGGTTASRFLTRTKSAPQTTVTAISTASARQRIDERFSFGVGLRLSGFRSGNGDASYASIGRLERPDRSPRPLRALADGLAPRRRRADRALQPALRAPHGRAPSSSGSRTRTSSARARSSRRRSSRRWSGSASSTTRARSTSPGATTSTAPRRTGCSGRARPTGPSRRPRSSTPSARRPRRPARPTATPAPAARSPRRRASAARAPESATSSACGCRTRRSSSTTSIRGRVEFPAEALDDFVLVRSDGHPLYHFCVCVDDADMRITHVIRGDDHLANTPKHVALFRALGAPDPAVRAPRA